MCKKKLRIVPRCLILSMALQAFLVAHLQASNFRLQLPEVFSDHMVIQSGVYVPIWGVSAPNRTVLVSFANHSAVTNSDSNGNWALKLSPLAISFTPGVLRVNEGKEVVRFEDILVGEVWLCSGQSNMYMPLSPLEPWFHGVEGGEEQTQRPEQPEIRLYCNSTHKEWSGLKLKGWQRADSTSRRRFSAVAWFFGQDLQKALNAPVGLMNISGAGTSIQSWMPTEDLLNDPLVRRYRMIAENNRHDIDEYLNAAGRYASALNENRRDVKAPEPLSDELMLAMTFKDTLFNTQIQPIIPFAIRGVIWYQGESNSFYRETAEAYDRMLRSFIEGWRTFWEQKRLPFYVVQLPCWNKSKHWMITRNGQLEAIESVQDAGLAVILDISDTTDLHPKEKRQVGERLARLALAKTYGRDIVCRGPVAKNILCKEDCLLITFDTGGGDIVLPNDSWNDIEIAGQDGIFKPAMATFAGNKARVWNTDVCRPISMRYGWKNVFVASLFNSYGLPASPFVVSKAETNNK